MKKSTDHNTGQKQRLITDTPESYGTAPEEKDFLTKLYGEVISAIASETDEEKIKTTITKKIEAYLSENKERLQEKKISTDKNFSR